MKERSREAVFAGGIVAVLLAGVVFDVRSKEVEPVDDLTVAGGRFAARSVFCPGSVRRQADLDLVVTSSAGERLSVGIEPQEDATVEVPAEGALVYDVSGARPADVVGYGAPASVSVMTTTNRPGDGAGAALCAGRAARKWYFASGSASINVDERILIYNPFPDEAVVRVLLFTPSGERSRSSLADIPVPAQDLTVVELNKAVQVQRTLAVEVTAERGRVVAWRQMFVGDKEGPPGLHFTLGAPEPGNVWHFPEGAVGGGATERISILNPGDEEAVATVTLAISSDEVLSPPELMELAIPPRSQLNVPVAKHVDADDEVVRVAATVRVVNDVPVVAEREVVYPEEGSRGVAAEIGAAEESERWLVPPAAAKSGQDAVVVLNPSSETTRVGIRLVDDDGVEIAAPDLEDVEIGPGGRVRLPIARWTEGRPVLAMVEATGPVVAERFAASRTERDVASVMGVPLR